MKNILVAVDLKGSDSWLLFHATSQAEKFGAKVWLIHVASPDPEFVGFEMGPKYIRDFRADELRTEHRLLQTYVEDLQKRSIDAEGLLIQGITTEMIEAEVAKLHIDMLVLGSHRHSLMYEVFVGNTASKIINAISIPVLLVPLPYET
jgi:nucleotide-binding universal stress UspA family protein